jgi:hypothetical protein
MRAEPRTFVCEISQLVFAPCSLVLGNGAGSPLEGHTHHHAPSPRSYHVGDVWPEIEVSPHRSTKRHDAREAAIPRLARPTHSQHCGREAAANTARALRHQGQMADYLDAARAPQLFPA